MQPFFGSKVKGKYGDENHESILDNLNGVGSQQIEKQERAPLFKPTGDSAYIHGASQSSGALATVFPPPHADFFSSVRTQCKHYNRTCTSPLHCI